MSKLFQTLDDYSERVQNTKEKQDDYLKKSKEKQKQFKEEFLIFEQTVLRSAIKKFNEYLSNPELKTGITIKESSSNITRTGFKVLSYDILIPLQNTILKIDFTGNEYYQKLFIYKEYLNKFTQKSINPGNGASPLGKIGNEPTVPKEAINIAISEIKEEFILDWIEGALSPSINYNGKATS